MTPDGAATRLFHSRCATRRSCSEPRASLGADSVSMREPEQADWRPTYVAKVGGRRAADWMRTMRELMGERRRAAIDAALARYRPVYLVDPPASCVVPGCSEPHRGRGLCHKHYMMWSRDKAKGRAARIAPLR